MVQMCVCVFHFKAECLGVNRTCGAGSVTEGKHSGAASELHELHCLFY